MNNLTKWIAVRAGGDAVRLLPMEGAGPDFFVKLADYEKLQEALTKLTNGYKYPTDVVTIAREALSMSDSEADQLALRRTDQT